MQCLRKSVGGFGVNLPLGINKFEQNASELWAVLVLLFLLSLITDKGDPTVYLHFGVLSHHFGLHFNLTTDRQKLLVRQKTFDL